MSNEPGSDFDCCRALSPKQCGETPDSECKRETELDARSLKERAARIVEGWRETDWPEGFDRQTAQIMADDLAWRIRALDN